MNLTESARAMCPYYVSYVKRRISCESCLCTTRLVFEFKCEKDAEFYKREYCDTHRWTLCEYAGLLNEKWSD